MGIPKTIQPIIPPPDWTGLELSFDSNKKLFYGAVLDSKETNEIPINSASGMFDVSPAVNIYDGNFHTVTFSWAYNDSSSFPNTINGVSALQKGILVVDGLLIGNQNTTWGGKKTPLNFVFNDILKATFIAIGAKFNSRASCSSISNNLEISNCFNGLIKQLVIWDRALTSNKSNMNITSGFVDLTPDDPNFSSPLYKTKFLGKSVIYDPLTGSQLKSYSGNVVAYYKFDQELTNSLTAKDFGGVTNGGAQTNPSIGNTASLFGGATLTNTEYIITDTEIQQEDSIFKRGYLEFEDENGIKRHIGTLYYDLGIAVLDNEYNLSGSGLPLLSRLSGSGITFDGTLSSNNFWIKSITFSSNENIERMSVNLSATGEMMNFTQNPTGIDKTTGKQLLVDNGGYVSSVGLYNDFNELVAVAKLNTPIRKDADHDVFIQCNLDF